MDSVNDDLPGLTVTVEELDNVTIGVIGEIDYATSDDLRSAVDDVLRRRPGSRLVFDFTQVGFMDSSGLALLIEAENRGAHVKVTGATPAVVLTFRTTGLDHLLEPGP